jgi:hypothetical protein
LADELVPLVRNDVTEWAPIAERAAVIATPVAKARWPVRKPALVLERPG